MTSLKFSESLSFLFLWIIGLAAKLNVRVSQKSGFISADIGDKVTLECFYKSDIAAMFYWYKQTLGEKPMLISTFYIHDKGGIFNDKFMNDSRFSLESKDGKNHLIISDLHASDSGTYYCVSCYACNFEFTEGVMLSVKGSGLNIPTSVQQSTSDTIQPRASLTLNCVVHPGIRDEEYTLYWFKSAERSHPGLIYTPRDRNDQCVYNLPTENINLSSAGTYCAVASCGHILFGDKIILEFEDGVKSVDSIVQFLSVALTFTTILIVVLAFLLYKMKEGNGCHCTESQARFSDQSANAEGNHDADNLHYSTLQTQRSSRSRIQRDDALTQWSSHHIIT
ncbi:uncharacterized protein KZ484_021899 isoform 1-T2 [Pholidichthys leucotaenia]